MAQLPDHVEEEEKKMVFVEEKQQDMPMIGEEETIRICVLGASGVGKSTLCNFLCKKDIFPVGTGFDSCTTTSASHSFTYKINNNTIQYEITDTPGWFDADNIRIPPLHTMLRRINECIKISQNGITAFFIVVPYERTSIDTEQSIHFMMDCFDVSQLRHVYMIFTKCKQIKNIQSILQTLLEQKKKGRKASALIYNYTQTINEQCFATECESNDEKELEQTRHTILVKMNSLFQKDGMIPDGVFQTAQRNYLQEINNLSHKHQIEQKKTHKRFNKILTLGTVIGVGFIAVGINGYSKYNTLMHHNAGLSKETNVLKNANDNLSNDIQELTTQNIELQNEKQNLSQENKKNNIVAGTSEAIAGALWFAIEPISGAIVILDGLSRVFGYSE